VHAADASALRCEAHDAAEAASQAVAAAAEKAGKSADAASAAAAAASCSALATAELALSEVDADGHVSFSFYVIERSKVFAADGDVMNVVGATDRHRRDSTIQRQWAHITAFRRQIGEQQKLAGTGQPSGGAPPDGEAAPRPGEVEQAEEDSEEAAAEQRPTDATPAAADGLPPATAISAPAATVFPLMFGELRRSLPGVKKKV
jgi:hypothetical protein